MNRSISSSIAIYYTMKISRHTLRKNQRRRPKFVNKSPPSSFLHTTTTADCCCFWVLPFFGFFLVLFLSLVISRSRFVYQTGQLYLYYYYVFLAIIAGRKTDHHRHTLRSIRLNKSCFILKLPLNPIIGISQTFGGISNLEPS